MPENNLVEFADFARSKLVALVSQHRYDSMLHDIRPLLFPYSQSGEAIASIREMVSRFPECDVSVRIVNADCRSRSPVECDPVRICPGCDHGVIGTFCENCQNFLVHLGDTI